MNLLIKCQLNDELLSTSALKLALGQLLKAYKLI